MAARIQVRRDTASNWTSVNPTLASGELGYETDTAKLKIGTGSAWNSTSYFLYEKLNLENLNDVTITSASNGDFLRWNGSAWINDAVNLSTDTIGDYVSSLVAGTGITLTDNSGEGATPTISVTANTYQPLDTELTALAGLTSAADKLPYFTGSGTASTTDITSAARSILDDTSVGDIRTTLGVGTADSVTFANVTATQYYGRARDTEIRFFMEVI